MKNIRKVLLLVKETYLEQVQALGDKAQLADIAARRSGVRDVEESHNQHIATLASVTKTLRDLGIEVIVLKRLDNFQELLVGVDLIITIGGDGTFLRISHEVQGYEAEAVPVLGVNSAPLTSFGHFCVTDKDGFSAVFQSILDGRFQPVKLLRLRLSIDGKPVAEPVLNEVLIAHKHPAGTTRYELTHATASATSSKTASHKGSGLLVAAPSGTTGFLRSEGGSILPIAARAFAFQKRAPFLRLFEKAGLLSGVAAEGDTLTVVSQMQGGKLFIDGDHIEYDFPRGATLKVTAAREDLVAYVHPDCHAPYQMESRLASWPLIGRLLAPLVVRFASISHLKTSLQKSNV